MFTKTDFQVLKFKFLAYSMQQAFYPFYKQNIALAWRQENTFIQAFCSVTGCQTCMYKRGINESIFKNRMFELNYTSHNMGLR